MDTPVAMLVFNRPDTTVRVLDRIRQARPKTLLVVCDAPREGHPTDAQQVREVRALFDQIDWPCERLTNYAEQNMGCGWRVSSGLNWVFQQVDRALIIEDDCLPNPGFFRFGQQMLDRYADHPDVGCITGFNPNGTFRPRSGYSFIRYPLIWGWGTWRRAWQKYDYKLSQWKSGRTDIFADDRDRHFWTHIFDLLANQTDENRRTTWDYQWCAALFANRMLCAMSHVNLIENIGFDARATHTTATSPLQFIPAFDPPDQLTHSEVKLNRRVSNAVRDLIFISGRKDQMRTRYLLWRAWLARRRYLGF
jgi:hypothetical protein